MDFLDYSFDNTAAFQKAGLGTLVYRMGDGEKFKRNLEICGDFLFLIRLLDNVLDGHYSREPLKEKEREVFLQNSYETLVNSSNNKLDIGKAGSKASLEMANYFKENSDEIALTENFLEDFEKLIESWAKDGKIKDLDEYSEIITYTGGKTLELTVDIAENFNDYKGSNEIREFSKNYGVALQLKDNLKDGEADFDKERLKELYNERREILTEFEDLPKSEELFLILDHFDLVNGFTEGLKKFGLLTS